MTVFRKSRGRIIFLAGVALACYFIYSAVSGAVQNHRLDQDRRDAEQQVRDLQDKKAYLQAVKDYVSSDAYVEQEARRQLGYTKDGEIAFAIVSPPAPAATAAAGDWWQRLFPR